MVKTRIGAKLYRTFTHNSAGNLLEDIVRTKFEDFDEELVTPGSVILSNI